MSSKKILFLHGFTQSASIFEAKTGALRKDFNKVGYTTIFAQGPLVPSTGEGFCWWRASELTYHGVEESILYLQELHKRDGPFCGIVGFSQGAGMAAIVAGILDPPPAFIVVCGGFLPRPVALQDAIKRFASSESGKSLHIVGAEDQITPVSVSLELYNIYSTETRTLLNHPGGHVIPQQSALRKAIVDWVL